MGEELVRAELRVLQRQYFQIVDPSQLKWPENRTLKRPDIQEWIFTNLFDRELIQYSPPDRYQMRVLKLLISNLERSIDDPEEDEISDNLLSAMSHFLTVSVPPEANSAQQKSYVTYSFPADSDNGHHDLDRAVTLLEARSVISSSGTTGLRTWEAALLLASYLASRAGETAVKGKKVLELGAGTGMLSIMCAKNLGVAGIVATDGDEAVIDAIKTNVFLNGLDSTKSPCAVRTAALRWGWFINPDTFADDYGMDAPDVILGADITYDKLVIPRLVTTISEFFELNPALQVLIAATIRNKETFEALWNACGRHGFNMEQVDFALIPEHLQHGPFYPTSTPIEIWRITRSL